MSNEDNISEAVDRYPQRDQATLMDKLEQVYQGYQQQHIYTRLEDIAEEMEKTLLQKAIAEELFDESFEINEEAKNTVSEFRTHLKKRHSVSSGGSSEIVSEARLDELEDSVNREAGKLSQQIQEEVLQHSSAVRAMEKLNEELASGDSGELSELSKLLEEWNWQTAIEDADNFEAKLNAAEDYASEMRELLDKTREELGSGFESEEIEGLVESLLDGDKLELKDLSSEEREALANSKLNEHLVLSLG